MAEFEVLIEVVDDVTDHPDADRLSLVMIRGYTCVSAKVDGRHRYRPGDLVVYVPEGAVVPEEMLRRGFWDETKGKGVLAGSAGDRVKAVRLRGIVSQGILYSVFNFEGFDPERHWTLQHFHPGVEPELGDDLTDLLGIVKYEAPIPQSMTGEARNVRRSFRFDVESIKKYPSVLIGSPVIAEEKVHGTCTIVGYDPDEEQGLFVSSKGLFSKGIVLKDTPENMRSNVYWRVFTRYNLGEKLIRIARGFNGGRATYLIGETYGPGIQDLTYSVDEVSFVGFAVVFAKENGSLFWCNPNPRRAILETAGISVPPLLYEGMYSLEAIEEVTGGRSALDPDTVREGVVVSPCLDFEAPGIGRAIVKSVSEEYLLRSGGTEHS